MTPMDQADIKPRMITTDLASQPIWFHIETRSNPTASFCRNSNPRIFTLTIIRSPHSSKKIPAPAGTVLLLEREIHRNCRNDFNGLLVQQLRLVTPLPDSFHCGLIQQRVTTDNSQIFDCALFADSRVQQDHALDASRSGQRRVLRLDLRDEVRLRDIATDSLGWRR